MIQLLKIKQSELKIKNISFLNYDVTDSKIDELFDDDSAKIPMCVYNTIGVIPLSKRQQFFETMISLAGQLALPKINGYLAIGFDSKDSTNSMLAAGFSGCTLADLAEIFVKKELDKNLEKLTGAGVGSTRAESDIDVDLNGDGTDIAVKKLNDKF